MVSTRPFLRALVVGACAIACASPEEPARIPVLIVVDSTALTPTDTDLGYRITWTSVRVELGNLAFTVAGEAHLAAAEPSLFRRVGDWLIPTAAAHPGHYEGGDIVGELLGRFGVSWAPDAAAIELGSATLFAGNYTALNFDLLRASTDDGLDRGDAMVGHTAILTGVASRNGEVRPFRIVIDSPEDRRLVGAPCEVDVREGQTMTLGFQFTPADPLEGDHLFDGVEFEALPVAGETVEILPESTDLLGDTYLQIRRRFQTHDHFRMVPRSL